MIKLSHLQIPEYWEVVMPSVMRAGTIAFPGNPDIALNVATYLLTGLAQLWLMVEDEKLVGYIITVINKDEFSNDKMLLLYFVYFLPGILDETVAEARETLLTYAKANKCSTIVTFSRRLGMEKILAKHWPGFKQHWVYTLEV